MILPKPLHDAALDRRLRGNAIRLLIVLWGHLDHVQCRPVKYLVVRACLGWSDNNIYRYLRELIETGYLERGPDVDRVGTYRLLLSSGFDAPPAGRGPDLPERRRRRLPGGHPPE